MSDPIRTLRRRIALTSLIGLGAISAVSLWAVRTPASPAQPDATLRPAAAPVEQAQPTDEFDAEAFDVALWHVPPAPEPVVEQAPARPPPPPRLTLVAIIREPTGDNEYVLRAALHDPDQAKLITVAAGERAGAYEVTRLTEEGVELSDGERTTWLALRPDEAKGVVR